MALATSCVPAEFTSLAVESSGGVRVTGTFGVAQTPDGGTTWTTQPSPAEPTAIFWDKTFRDGRGSSYRNALINGQPEVQVSRDAGHSWHRVRFPVALAPTVATGMQMDRLYVFGGADLALDRSGSGSIQRGKLFAWRDGKGVEDLGLDVGALTPQDAAGRFAYVAPVTGFGVDASGVVYAATQTSIRVKKPGAAWSRMMQDGGWARCNGPVPMNRPLACVQGDERVGCR